MLKIYDLPLSQGQVHIHGDAAYGRICDYSRQVYRPLNAYESAMADFYAQRVGLPSYDRPSGGVLPGLNVPPPY